MLLAHLSDPHVLDWSGIPWRRFRGKRATGWANFKFFRGKTLRADVLRALLEDIVDRAPDHIAVTGDITGLAFAQEMRAFGRLVDGFGFDPAQVSLVPGNHDAYTHHSWRRGRFLAELGRFCTSDLHGGMPGFPYVRLRGPIALIGLNTAIAGPYFTANGLLGKPQINRLKELLEFRPLRGKLLVFLLHHPPVSFPNWFKEVHAGLLDRERFVAQLNRSLEGRPALVLCGHWHRRRRTVLDLDNQIEILQISSAAQHGGGERKQAAYQLIRFRELSGGGILQNVEVRGYDPQRERVVTLAKWSGWRVTG